MTGLRHRLGLGYAAVLFAGWLLLSGHITAQFLLLGAASCVLVMWLSARMRLGPISSVGAPHPAPHPWRTMKYAAWLGREMFISNLKVARMILDPRLPIRPVLFRAPTGQKTDFGRVIFANSITLTPGTISVEIPDDGGHILVHSLHEDFSWDSASCDMDRRIAALGV